MTEIRLIDANALKEEIKELFCPDGYKLMFIEYIDNAPTVCGNNPKWCESCVSNGKCASTRPKPEITDEDIQNAIKQGYKDGYKMAKAKYERPQGECEKCTYRIFTEKFSDSIAEVMTLYGITSIEELQARLQEEMRGKEE